MPTPSPPEPAPQTGTAPDEALGGRLELLPMAELSAEQAELHEQLRATRLAAARQAGYTAALPDGRLIGPFNALLRTPAIGAAQLACTRAIGEATPTPEVREAIILTVAAQWQAPYIRYAHTHAAHTAGMPQAAISALRKGTTPVGLTPAALTAHRLAIALVRDHDVADELYAQASSTFGDEGLVALVALIGQYQATAALLACFHVPAPPESP
jgi:4-carboxymuconolactone decarboxylase